jgi:predicted AAA+ superfamily ATPase
MFIKRHLEQVIQNANQAYSILLLTGPRQVGKTTLLRTMAGTERTYVTLDNPAIRELAVTDPELFLQRYQPPMIIDEIQYAPQLLPYIKMYVDEHKRKGAFWLTGSQMFHLMKNVSESLAGRVAVIPIQGLSQAEITDGSTGAYQPDIDSLSIKLKTANEKNVQEIFKRIHKGSMPALYETEQDIELFYSSYVNTYLQRDIRELTQVGDELAFLRFMTACAARTGQLLNYSELAKDVGISPPTAKQWLSMLVSSGIVILIEPYFNNALKRIVKSPRLYFMDTGLCAWLTRWTNPEALEVSAMSGAFFETYVVSEIYKSYLNAGKRPPLFYYRDTDGKEIDLIIEQNDVLYPIEVKKSGTPKADAIRHFKALEKTGKRMGTGNLICVSRELLPIDRQNLMVPVWLI